MAVRTAYPGTESVGDVLTKANFDKLPGGTIGYAQVTSGQSSITTVVDLTSLTVGVTVGASRLILIQAQCEVASTISADICQLSIQESSTVLTRSLIVAPASAANATMACSIYLVAPSTGSHTYKLTMQRAAGTGTLTMGASATSPAYILVHDMGPSF